LALVVASILLSVGSCDKLQPTLYKNALQQLHPAIAQDVELVITSDGLGGYFTAPGTTVLSNADAFKEHLVEVLKTEDQHLHLDRLLPEDLRARQAEAGGLAGAVKSAFSKRHVLATSSKIDFVPERVRINFEITANYTRGVSKKALQDALGRIIGRGGAALLNSSSHQSSRSLSTQRELQSSAEVCDEKAYEDKCTTACAEYSGSVCMDCKCDEDLTTGTGRQSGTPQCLCFVSGSITGGAMGLSTIYAFGMLKGWHLRLLL
jgi:hypothetical protein